MPLLTNDHWLAKLSKCIDAANQQMAFELVAFVYMPEHLHLLVFPLDVEPDMGRYLAAIKKPLSDHVRQCLEQKEAPLLQKLTVRERPGKFCFRFWQEGSGFDRNIFTPKVVEASMSYIHKNPVERSLCRRSVDWKWSSARYYLDEPGKRQFANLPHIDGVRPEMLERNAGQ
jgi:putative transposase